MKEESQTIKSRLSEGAGITSGILGGIGSIHNVCHSICAALVFALATFGITTSILPLMFLQTYQLYFWLGAVVFTGLSFYFYFQQKNHKALDRNLLFINIGLLIFSLPFSLFADYMDFFRFIGISITIIGIFLLIFGKKLRSLKYSMTGSEQTLPPAENVDDTVMYEYKISTLYFPKINLFSAIFALVIVGFFINQYLIYRMGVMGSTFSPIKSSVNQTGQTVSQMKLTLFDVALAKERMDKNNDGLCDSCGMDVQQCIDSGQVDCNMGNNPTAIGILGSQHIHADWKIYIDGKPFNWTSFADLHERQMKGDTSVTNTSAFIHIHPAQAPEKEGDVLHMHATKVPLNIFFRSIGMNLTKDSFTLANGRVLKNENGNTLKFYLDGKKVDKLDNYVFQALDKILISYGPENDPDIQRQLSSITDFAKNH